MSTRPPMPIRPLAHGRAHTLPPAWRDDLLGQRRGRELMRDTSTVRAESTPPASRSGLSAASPSSSPSSSVATLAPSATVSTDTLVLLPDDGSAFEQVAGTPPPERETLAERVLSWACRCLMRR